MFSKLVRLGKDAELATTASGKQVCKIVAAYDVGWGDNKKTVWVNASWWGDRGSKIAQYLTKGTQIVIHGDDVEPQSYTDKTGAVKTSLNMTISNVELISRSQQGSSQGTQPQQSYQSAAPAQSSTPPAQPQSMPSGFSDFDDDIPF